MFITSVIGFQAYSPAAADPNIQITDVQVPDEVPQASRGQVQATVENLLNLTFDGWARFSDTSGDIRSINPFDPLRDLVNFTIGPFETKTVIVDYVVNDTAMLGTHIATFEINVGDFSFLFEQYSITIIPVAAITEVVPGSIFTQSGPGFLLVSIENRVDQTQTVRIDIWGPKFINASQEVDLAPGTNTIAIPLMPNVSHVYDFGMFPANVSMFYQDDMLSSEVVLVPVDMTLLNQIIAIILPVGIFLALVLFYAFRKRGRVRAAASSE